MLIEGMGFVLAIGAYFYLHSLRASLAAGPTPPPSLFWATTVLVIALLSEIPNFWLDRAARATTPAVQWG